MTPAHKSNKGYVDLMFSSLGSNLSHIKNVIKKLHENDMLIVKTGKSGTVRIKCPIIDFTDDFDKQVHKLEAAFEAVIRLVNLSEKIDYDELYNI